mmetsp:Transcript_28330/g.72882  ORF Transcript_28330/g.72882 Transcript_28330/m.72882 type:complete len:206 (-) Transcript_28330:7-624(-)
MSRVGSKRLACSRRLLARESSEWIAKCSARFFASSSSFSLSLLRSCALSRAARSICASFCARHTPTAPSHTLCCPYSSLGGAPRGRWKSAAPSASAASPSCGDTLRRPPSSPAGVASVSIATAPGSNSPGSPGSPGSPSSSSPSSSSPSSSPKSPSPSSQTSHGQAPSSPLTSAPTPPPEPPPIYTYKAPSLGSAKVTWAPPSLL